MIDPGTGTLVTGGRVIWGTIKWIINSQRAPWSVVTVSAQLRPHVHPWYSVMFTGMPEKPFAIELVSVRTARPKKLLLRRASPESPVNMADQSGAIKVEGLNWHIPANTGRVVPYERFLFVNLDGLKGDVKVDFEFGTQFLDNRRTTMSTMSRTNTVTIGK